MAHLIVLSLLVAVATAAPSGLTYAVPGVAVAPAVPVRETIITAPVRHQYHAQDELGQYSYGYTNEDGQHKSEARGVDGTVVGNYGYVAPDGQKVNINYLANDNGFQAAGEGIPVAPVAEVKAAVPAVAVAEAPVAVAIAEAPVAVAPAAVAVAPQPAIAEVRAAVAPAPAVAVAPAPAVAVAPAPAVAVAPAHAYAVAPAVTEVRAAPYAFAAPARAYAVAPAPAFAVAPAVTEVRAAAPAVAVAPAVTALRTAIAPGPVVTEVRSVPAIANVPAVATTSQLRGEAVASPLGGHVASSIATSAHHYNQPVAVHATEVRTHQLGTPVLVADTIVHNPGLAYTY